MTYERPTQPLSIDGVLVDGFNLFRASIRSLYVPAFLLALLVGMIGPIPVSDDGGDLDVGAYFRLRFFASLVASFYMWGVIAAIVHYIASSSPRGVRSPLSIATHRFPTILAVHLLNMLAFSIGLLLLIIPGIFLFVALCFSPILPITEGKGPIESLRGSFDLVKGYWWRAFAIVAMMLAIGFLMGRASGEIALFLADWFEGDLVKNAVSTLTYTALEAIILPLCFCPTYAMYQDLRLRQTTMTP